MSPAEAHKPGFLKKARFNVFKFHAILLGLLASLCYASDLGVFGTLQQVTQSAEFFFPQCILWFTSLFFGGGALKAAKIVGINDPVTPHHMRTAGLMLLMAMFANIVAAWPNFFQSFFGKFISTLVLPLFWQNHADTKVVLFSTTHHTTPHHII